MRYVSLITIITLASFCFCSAQKSDSISFKNTILPIAFYLPETSVGLGGTGIFTYRNKNESKDLRPSQILYSAVYTFKKQLLLFFPFEIYKDNNSKRFKGELGYYRYFYNYFGIGANSNGVDLETYAVNFPRINFNYALTKDKVWYFGVGFKFDQFDINDIKTDGLLATEKPVGYEGGRKTNITLIALRDTRDNIISTSKGSYLEIELERSLPSLVSSFNYLKAQIDYRFYYAVIKEWTIATRLLSSHADSSTPFFDLPYISDPKRARGFSDRRYLANNIISFQSELRYPLYKRFSGSIFFSSNAIYDGSALSFENHEQKWSAGLGFRYEIDPEEKTRIRLDIATGNKLMNFYITMNEAF